MPKSLSVRTRVVISVAAMLLPLLALSATSTLALRGTLDGFSATADEATGNALPLAQLKTMVFRVERSGMEAAWKADAASVAAYERAARDMNPAFEDYLAKEPGAETPLVRAAQESAGGTTFVLNMAIATRETMELDPSPQTQSVLDSFQRHTDTAVGKLAQAQRISQGHITEREQAAHTLEHTATTTMVLVTILGLLIAIAGGLHLVRSVLRPLGQGYHFARPESGEDVGQRLAATPRPTAA